MKAPKVAFGNTLLEMAPRFRGINIGGGLSQKEARDVCQQDAALEESLGPSPADPQH